MSQGPMAVDDRRNVIFVNRNLTVTKFRGRDKLHRAMRKKFAELKSHDIRHKIVRFESAGREITMRIERVEVYFDPHVKCFVLGEIQDEEKENG